MPDARPCSRCGAKLRYYGRRDLLALVRQHERMLGSAFDSASALADVAALVLSELRRVRVESDGICIECVS